VVDFLEYVSQVQVHLSSENYEMEVWVLRCGWSKKAGKAPEIWNLMHFSITIMRFVSKELDIAMDSSLIP
jgi:hypothetical protein